LSTEEIQEFAQAFTEAKRMAGISTHSWSTNSIHAAIWDGVGPVKAYELYEKLADCTRQAAAVLIERHPSFKLGECEGPFLGIPGLTVPRLNFTQAKLYRVDLQGVFLYKCVLDGVRLKESNLSGACVAYSLLRGMTTWYSTLQYAWIEYADWTDSQLRNLDMRFSWLEGSTLNGVGLHNVKMEGVELEDAQWPALPPVPYAADFVVTPETLQDVLAAPTRYTEAGLRTTIKQTLRITGVDISRDLYELNEVSEFISKLQMSVNNTSWDECRDFFMCLLDFGAAVEGERCRAIVSVVFFDEAVRRAVALAQMHRGIACADQPPDKVVSMMKEAAACIKNHSSLLRKTAADEQARIRRIKELQDRLLALTQSAILATFFSVGNLLSSIVFVYVEPLLEDHTNFTL
jgi:hypothetical protein